MIIEKIKDILDLLDKKLNKKEITFSSENPFVFHFAYELFKKYEDHVKFVDFEVQLFEKIVGIDKSSGKYLDLLIEFKKRPKPIKVGFEFKYPKKGGGGTKERRRIIHDLKRINSLVAINKIDIGVFICATNNNHFMKKQNSFKEFQTYPGKSFIKGDLLPKDSKEEKEEKLKSNYGYSPQEVKCQSNIKFEWNHLNEEISDKLCKYSIKKDKWSFLVPIIISKNSNNFDY